MTDRERTEYMTLMESASCIQASGLEGDYRRLAEFNNVVLAGHKTKYGMEFVTWEWVQNHTSLWQGHYYGDSYDAAKRDFIVRSGLIQKSQLFDNQQLAEIYRCVHETLDSEYPITTEREKILAGLIDQIEEAVPELENLVNQSNQQEIERGVAMDTPGMI